MVKATVYSLGAISQNYSHQKRKRVNRFILQGVMGISSGWPRKGFNDSNSWSFPLRVIHLLARGLYHSFSYKSNY